MCVFWSHFPKKNGKHATQQTGKTTIRPTTYQIWTVLDGCERIRTYVVRSTCIPDTCTPPPSHQPNLTSANCWSLMVRRWRSTFPSVRLRTGYWLFRVKFMSLSEISIMIEGRSGVERVRSLTSTPHTIRTPHVATTYARQRVSHRVHDVHNNSPHTSTITISIP